MKRLMPVLLVLLSLITVDCYGITKDLVDTDRIQTLENKLLKFPATQNNSADVNTLDDYEEGLWTPVLTFATPGDLAVTYAIQTGTYTKIGNIVHASWFIATSAFTYTNAASVLRITGLQHPSSSSVVISHNGTLSFGGILKENYTQFTPVVSAATSYITIGASGSGQTHSNIGVGDVPSGGTVLLSGSVVYRTD